MLETFQHCIVMSSGPGAFSCSSFSTEEIKGIAPITQAVNPPLALSDNPVSPHTHPSLLLLLQLPVKPHPRPLLLGSAQHYWKYTSSAGLLGANFAQILLNAGKFTDPIARGLSTSGAAHGLGTAAMAAT